ncbi:hypothetical protein CBM2585_A140150 [Cupriavidus taiwanensis]|nr:hypothetical protein CBM2585_A140150 [Cupriavidus taiwanensis]SPC11755.1 hypothetical protein CT19431_40454 [Cupriavidus taiwanensis]
MALGFGMAALNTMVRMGPLYVSARSPPGRLANLGPSPSQPVPCPHQQPGAERHPTPPRNPGSSAPTP